MLTGTLWTIVVKKISIYKAKRMYNIHIVKIHIDCALIVSVRLWNFKDGGP